MRQTQSTPGVLTQQKPGKDTVKTIAYLKIKQPRFSTQKNSTPTTLQNHRMWTDLLHNMLYMHIYDVVNLWNVAGMECCPKDHNKLK